jgi:hypothetical protein
VCYGGPVTDTSARRPALMRRGGPIVAMGVLVMCLSGAGACRRSPSPAMDADEVLRRMSNVLAGAKRLGITARREADPDLAQGRDLPALTTVNVRLVRPQRIAVELDGGGNRRAMYSDGNAFTLQDVTRNLYSTIPLKATLDDLDEQLERVYGFVPPMFEFVTNNPYESIRARVNSVAYLGLAPDAAGVQCHRLAVAGDMADAELWVNAADFLPRQLIATFKTIASRPKLRLYFSAWDLAPGWPDSGLAFTPPAGAVKIPMRSVAEMQALMGKEKR